MQTNSKKVLTESSQQADKAAPKKSVSPEISEANSLWRSLATHVSGASDSLPIQSKPAHPTNEPQIQRMCTECDEEATTDIEVPIQTKLTVGAADDPYEKEADAVADKVMRMPQSANNDDDETTVQTKPLANQITPLVQRAPVGQLNANESQVHTMPKGIDTQRQMEGEQEEEAVQLKQESGHLSEQGPNSIHSPANSTSPIIQRVCARCEQEVQRQPSIQPKSVRGQSPQISPATAANIHALNGSGSPLSRSTRSFFEPRFGADFSQVRVHTDTRAAETAKSINARAFTVGRNVAFGAGQYTPESSDGRRLLGHELTHVVQQNGERVYRKVYDEPSEGIKDPILEQIRKIHEYTWIGPSDESKLEKLWASFGKEFPRMAITYWSTWNESISYGLEPTLVEPISWLIQRLIGNPEASADRAVAMIQAVDVERLYAVKAFIDTEKIHLLAASTPGREALKVVAQKFDDEGDLSLAKRIKDEFEYRDNPVPASVASRESVALINDALAGETSFKKMLYDDWLKLPVTPYDFGTVEDGGVYYDGGLGTPAAVEADQKAVGKTVGIKWGANKKRGIPSSVPLIYIRVGPRVLADLIGANSDFAAAIDPAEMLAKQTEVDAAKALIRSTIYHEFHHLLDYRQRRDPDSSAEERALADSPTNAETRAYASQLTHYGTELTPKQVSSLLQSLSTTLPFSSSDVRRGSVDQIIMGFWDLEVSNVRAIKDFSAIKELISKLSPKEQKGLALLTAGIDTMISKLEGPSWARP